MKRSFTYLIPKTPSRARTNWGTLKHGAKEYLILSTDGVSPLVRQVCTMMATIPMQNAEYVAAGAADSWRHYALNIPIYTHFTSPIRRYADVMVHRILTATLEGTVENTYAVDAIAETAHHCNEKRLAAKMAQERSDEVRIFCRTLVNAQFQTLCTVEFRARCAFFFLPLYPHEATSTQIEATWRIVQTASVRCEIQVYLAVHVASNPLEEEAVVISVGEQSFTVNVPRLGVTSRIFTDKIPDIAATFDEAEKIIRLQASSTTTHSWTDASIKVFAKVQVLCTVAESTGPIQIELKFLRPKQ